MRCAAAIALTALCCTSVDRYRGAKAPDAPKITVLVPGYQGTFLYDGDKRVWISPGEAFSRGDFSLGSCDGGRLPLQPGGPITGFTIFPVSIDVYGGLMDWADQRFPGFVGFGYDWRANLLDSAQQLCDFIGDRHADVIAHSMGGLVTWLAVQRCGQHIDRAVFAGTPFGGAPGVFKDLFRGTETVRNTALLSPEALWTFSATWQVLPVRDDFFVDGEGKRVEVPISDPAAWRDWPQACPGLLGDRLKDRARVQLPVLPVPHALVVVGQGRQVTDAIRWTGSGFDLEHPLRADGDSTVVVSRAIPPFKAERLVYTSAAHVALLNDEGVRAAIEEFLKR
jgi:pimeloyl-ACP methyl ester carboxylesterase